MKVDGSEVEIKNTDKVFFPDENFTKGDVIDYYYRAAPHILSHLKDRPLVMKRYPDGVDGESFFQKEVPDYFPDWVETVTVPLKKGGTQELVLCNDARTLVYLADQAVLSFHPWLSLASALDQPTHIIFDLDPDNGDIAPVRELASVVGEALRERDYEPRVMTSGSKGFHVWARVAGKDFDQTRDEAQEIAAAIADQHPERYTTKASKDAREGKIYLDVARNAYGQTSVAPYSLRAKPKAPVAAPLTWEELAEAKPDPQSYTANTIFKRLSQKGDPWAE